MQCASSKCVLSFLFCFVFLDEAVMAQKGSLCSVSLGVEGMTCGSCVQSIEQRIGSLPGVVDIKVHNDCKDICLCFSFIVKIFFVFPQGFKQFNNISCI